MARQVALYGAVGGVLIALLKIIEYKHFVLEYPSEIYGGLVALIFTSLGIYFGLRWTRAKQVVVIREVPVRMDGPFILNAEQLKDVGLTPREHEILALIAQGLSNREIGAKLFVSENTVKTHSSRLFEKMQVNPARPGGAEGERAGPHPLIHTFVDPGITRKHDDNVTAGPYLAPRKETHMKRIVIIFGLISGVISSALMFLTLPLMHTGAVNFSNGYILGYTSIVLSFLLVVFGIRAYRENNGGTISFGRAFSVGILITLISCVFYVASWEVIYFKIMPDFADKYAAHAIGNMRAKGATDAAIAAKKVEMEKMKTMLNNPLLNAAMTFIEPFPVGLIMTLVSAAILRRKTPAVGAGVAQAV